VKTGETDEYRTLNGRLMREWVQVWRQEDPGKCNAGDADRMVQTKTVTPGQCYSFSKFISNLCIKKEHPTRKLKSSRQIKMIKK